MTIAFWCVFVAGILPYVPITFASGRDNNNPRLTKLEGLPARAIGAHQNAFEAFPFFAAAVIIAHLIEGPSAIVNGLALLFLVARVLHIVFYLGDRAPLRSAAWTVGYLLVIAIFIQAAFH